MCFSHISWINSQHSSLLTHLSPRLREVSCLQPWPHSGCWEAAAAHEVTQVIYYIISLSPLIYLELRTRQQFCSRPFPVNWMLLFCQSSWLFTLTHIYLWRCLMMNRVMEKKKKHNSLMLYLNSLDRGHFSLCSIAVVTVYILTQMSSP